MRRALLLFLALSLPTGSALGQETPQSESPPPPEPAQAPAAEEPQPPEAPAIPKAPAPPPREESKSGMETLISGDFKSGGYGGPVLMYSRILGRDAIFIGGRGAWVLNHSFAFGAGGFGMTTRVPAPEGAPDIDEELRTELAYGGLWLEYILLPDKIVHMTLGTLIGAGGVSYSRIRRTQRETREVENDVFFVLDPVLSAELNILPSLRVSAGVGYRFVGNVDLTGLSRKDLSGFTGSLMIKFGRF